MFHATSRSIAAASRMVEPGRDPKQPSNDVETLRARLEHQQLLMQTLLMILLEKKVLHEDEFKEWMIYVDELDGARDGKLRAASAPLSCPSCKRNSPYGSTKCIYCSTEFPPEFLVRKPGGDNA